MTKADFIKALEPYPDDMELFVVDMSDGMDFFWKIDKVSQKLVTDIYDGDSAYLGKLVIALE